MGDGKVNSMARAKYVHKTPQDDVLHTAKITGQSHNQISGILLFSSHLPLIPSLTPNNQRLAFAIPAIPSQRSTLFLTAIVTSAHHFTHPFDHAFATPPPHRSRRLAGSTICKLVIAGTTTLAAMAIPKLNNSIASSPTQTCAVTAKMKLYHIGLCVSHDQLDERSHRSFTKTKTRTSSPLIDTKMLK
jgi:hypothetical protein